MFTLAVQDDELNHSNHSLFPTMLQNCFCTHTLTQAGRDRRFLGIMQCNCTVYYCIGSRWNHILVYESYSAEYEISVKYHPISTPRVVTNSYPTSEIDASGLISSSHPALKITSADPERREITA